MLSWDALNKQLVTYFLDDQSTEESKMNFKTPLRIMAWNEAQKTFAAHTAMERLDALALDAAHKWAPAPDRLVKIVAVLGEDGQPIPRSTAPGVNAALRTTYMLWANRISFSREVQSATLQYLSLWPNVEYALEGSAYAITQPAVYVPEWATGALLHLTAAFCLQPHAITAALSRNFGMKPIDSGGPLDNSRAEQAREHWAWYQKLISAYPSQAVS